MTSNDLFQLHLAGILMPIGSLLLCMALATVILKEGYASYMEALIAASARIRSRNERAAEPVSVAVKSVRPARGRVSTGMRSTRHPYLGNHCVVA